MAKIKKSCKPAECLRASIIPLACFLLVASVAAMVMVAELVLVEHVGSRHFVMTECLVVEHVDTGLQHCDRCISSGGYHTYTDCYESKFPCIQVKVRLTELNGTEEIATLHVTKKQLDENPDCSESVCNRQESSNRKVIDEFLSKWPLNHVASCAYNPFNPQEVLVAKHYSTEEAVHAILWPSLIFAICLIVLIARCVSGNDPCAQKVKSWDPVTLRSMRDSCRVRCGRMCPWCVSSEVSSESPTSEPHNQHENIAFDKF